MSYLAASSYVTNLESGQTQISQKKSLNYTTLPGQSIDNLIRVGILLPLSGASIDVGQQLLNAAQMALFDTADQNFVLHPYDTRGTPEGAEQAAHLAVANGSQLILGPVFSSSARAVTPVAKAANIPVIAYTTDPTVAGENIFVMGFLVHEQIRRILRYSASQGIKKLAILAPSTPYGETAVDAAFQVFNQAGGTISKVAYYDPSGSNLDQVVREFADYDLRHTALLRQREELEQRGDEISIIALKRLERLDTIGDIPYDAILIPEYGGRLMEVSALLPFYDIDPARVQLLGTMLWYVKGLGKEPALVGGWHPAPAIESNLQFSERYESFYGSRPLSIATHGYDSVALAAVLAKTKLERPFSSATLLSSSGFQGVDGVFRFLPTGLSERGFAVLEINRQGAEVIDSSPTTFRFNENN
jgi:ABC-type branched-subunit amino acid transport system substrate-binding protein